MSNQKYTGIAAIFAFLIALEAAFAQARPDTRRLMCKEASQLVKQSGALVMSTGRFTFERIVAGRGFCDGDQTAERLFAPTRDKRRCFVGHKCVPGIQIGSDP